MIYTYCPIERRAEVIMLSSHIPGVKEFGYSWTHWKNWDEQPPVIAIADLSPFSKRVVGFHATTFSKKSGYLNLYFHGVADDFVGRGIAKGMFNYLLTTKTGYKRIKLKTAVNSSGEKFCRSLGMIPFAKVSESSHGAYYIWDECLKEVHDIETLKLWMTNRLEHEPIPPAEIRRHLKYNPGMELL